MSADILKKENTLSNDSPDGSAKGVTRFTLPDKYYGVYLKPAAINWTNTNDLMANLDLETPGEYELKDKYDVSLQWLPTIGGPIDKRVLKKLACNVFRKKEF